MAKMPKLTLRVRFRRWVRVLGIFGVIMAWGALRLGAPTQWVLAFDVVEEA